MKKEYLVPQIKTLFKAKEELCNALSFLSWNMAERPEGDADEDAF